MTYWWRASHMMSLYYKLQQASDLGVGPTLVASLLTSLRAPFCSGQDPHTMRQTAGVATKPWYHFSIGFLLNSSILFLANSHNCFWRSLLVSSPFVSAFGRALSSTGWHFDLFSLPLEKVLSLVFLFLHGLKDYYLVTRLEDLQVELGQSPPDLRPPRNFAVLRVQFPLCCSFTWPRSLDSGSLCHWMVALFIFKDNWLCLLGFLFYWTFLYHSPAPPEMVDLLMISFLACPLVHLFWSDIAVHSYIVT